MIWFVLAVSVVLRRAVAVVVAVSWSSVVVVSRGDLPRVKVRIHHISWIAMASAVLGQPSEVPEARGDRHKASDEQPKRLHPPPERCAAEKN